MSRLGIFAGICLAVPALFAQTNLVKNPGFEEDGKGWWNWNPGGKAKYVTDDVKSGKKALRFEFNIPKSQGIFTAYTEKVKPLTGYTFSCWMKGSAGVLQAKIFFRDANGKYLGEAAPFSGCDLKDWFHVRKTFTTPKNTERLQVGVLIKNGYVIADDFSVTEGMEQIQADNELLNTSFRYSCRTDGMPDYWCLCDYNINFLRPEQVKRPYFHKAANVKSPVPGTDVLQYKNISSFLTFPVTVAGNQWYTLSVYVKSEQPDARITLQAFGAKKVFTVGKNWQRLELTGFRKSAGEISWRALLQRANTYYVAAPMLEAGKKATQWRPNPMDAMLPNLWAGEKPRAKQAGPLRAVCPTAQSWKNAATLDSFCNIKDGKFIKGKFKGSFYFDKGVLHAAVDLKTGKKALAPSGSSVQHPDNEIAELFLSPREGGAPYWHFMIGRNGTTLVQKGTTDLKNQGGWGHTVKEIPGGWRAEFAIPLAKVIDLPGQKSWRMSLCATEVNNAKPAYYSASGKKGFHSPGGFMIVTGLPFGGKVVEPPVRIATDYDLYMKESKADVLVEDMKFPADLKVRDEKGKVYFTAKMTGKTAVIPLGKLPNGYYVVEVSGNGKTASTYFRKLAYQKNAARVNRFKQYIELNEKPFFPTIFSWGGIGCQPTEWVCRELKKHNFNTIMIMPETYRMKKEKRLETVRAFAKAGFKIVVWGDCPRKFSGIQVIVNERKAQLAEFAEFKDSIIGWYFVDEIAPFWEKRFNLKESDYAKGYRQLKDHSPYMLYFINWNYTGFGSGEKFYGARGKESSTDIYSYDCYPYSRAITFGALDTYEGAADIVSKRQSLDFLPGIVWLQTYGYHEGLREPHQTEYQNNVFINLIYNQTGFMNFISRPDSNELWEGMSQSYGAALKWLNMTAEPGSKFIKRGKINGISYALWKNGKGGYAFVAANTHYAKGEIEIESGIKGGKTELIGGKGDLTVKNGKLKVKLPIAGSAAWFIK